MNEKDKAGVLLIVGGVLLDYLSTEMTNELINEISKSLQANWHIVKLMQERAEGNHETAV